MDNISHAVFGGSIVHAIRWKKYGNKALAYAMLASNMPDIDIALKFIPWVDSVRADFAHRTMTHSFLFAFLAAPLLGRVLSRITKSWKTWRKDWSLITLVSLLSHIFLDRCTTYGIWFLRPFVDVWFESRIISVIDLFFTLPLIAIIVYYFITWRKKNKHKKAWWTRYLWVWFATLYLSMMAILQSCLKSSIESDMTLAWVQYNRIFAAPQLLQPFLWYGMVELPDWSYKATYTSVFDTKPRLYENIYGYHDMIMSIERTNPLIKHIIARSHNWYSIWNQWDTTTFSDLRFGKLLWRDKQNRWNNMFQYVISDTTVSQGGWQRFTQPFSFIWEQHWRRVRGN